MTSPEKQNIAVMSFRQAQKKKRAFDAVITIEDPGTRDTLRFNKTPHPEHIVLKFHDIDFRSGDFRHPEEDQVDHILAFGRRHIKGSLLIHCQAGISRSTAAALAILADRYGKGREPNALHDLLRLRPQALPNFMVVELADKLLDRNGELVRVMETHEQIVAHRLAPHRHYL